MALAAFAGTTAPALAQTPPPSAATQGLPTRDEVTRPVAPPAPTGPRLKVEGDVERSPCPLADPAYANVRVDIRHASFSRLVGVTEAELEAAYRPWLGENRPVSDICEIRDAVATVLRRKGYLAAVQVPTQQIENGEVKFEILYARLTAIRVRGDAGNSERLIASYLDKLTQDEVFNMHAAERYLLLARDLPGLDVRLALKPTGQPGEVYGEVTVTHRPIEADLNIQNMGSHNSGPWGGQARVQFNGLTGMGDQTSIAFYSTSEFKEQQVLQLGHQFRVGSEGLAIAGRFTYAWTRPDLDPAPDLLRARTLFATLEARYPLVRTQAHTLWAAGGLDFVNQTVRFDKTEITEDRLRIAYLRLDGDMVDLAHDRTPAWHAAYSLELRQGLSIFDATRWPRTGVTPPSRNDGDVHGTLIRGSASGELSLARNLSFAGAVTGQYSFDPLFSFEEYSAGNYTIGRGYDPGTLLGEDGIGLSAELRIDRLTPLRAPVALQPFVFVDTAWVWNKGAGGDDQLTSVGGGIRASYADRFRLDLTLAVPTERTGFQTRRGDARLLVSLTTKLWPWGAE